MASAQVVETSVTNYSPSQDSNHPDDLFQSNLSELEYRLPASRLAFQKLMQAPRGKQFKINGNIVNVPVDVTNSVALLL